MFKIEPYISTSFLPPLINIHMLDGQQELCITGLKTFNWRTAPELSTLYTRTWRRPLFI